MTEFVTALAGFAEHCVGSEEVALITRERHRQLLGVVAGALRRSLAVKEQGEELVAEELRGAAYSLGRLLGRVDVEDVLDVIFRDFCLGK